MSFTETRLDLGIDYGTRGELRFSTSIIVDGSGEEQRNANWSQPLGRWQLGDRTLDKSELDYFLGFHAARKGAFEGFRFKDWADYQAHRQKIGVGDGTKTKFQLIKTYTIGSYSVKRPILKPVGDTVEIYLNGRSSRRGWAVDITTGIITFNEAPDIDVVISSTFEFDVPVRFEQDKIEFRFDAYEVGTGRSIFYLANLSVVELRLQPVIATAHTPLPTQINEVLDLGYDYGTVGGPAYNTTITSVGASYESRTSNWDKSRGRWQIGDRTLARNELDYLIAFFRATRGSGIGFFYKDWASVRNVPVRFEADSIEVRFDAYDPAGSGEVIFYLSGLPLVETTISNHASASPLNGLRWELPCAAPYSDGIGCFCPNETLVTANMDGSPYAIYDISLRFRGVVETKEYTGGTNDGAFWQVGGSFPATDFNVYSLEISAPPQIFYLNRGQDYGTRCYAIDYTKTIQIKGGATVALRSRAFNNLEVKNHDENKNPILVPGVPPYPNPYNGQFIQINVVSIN